MSGRGDTWYPLFVLLIVILVAGVCTLIGCVFCNPITWMYSKYKKKGDYVRWEAMQEEMGEVSHEPTQSEKRRESLRSKYNL